MSLLLLTTGASAMSSLILAPEAGLKEQGDEGSRVEGVQLGGHGSSSKKPGEPVLFEDGLVWKPVPTKKEKKALGKREIEFYKKQNQDQNSPLKDFLSKFHGVGWRDNKEGISTQYIKMENIAKPFKLSTISSCDIKMGTSATSPNEKADKVERQREQYPQMKDIGFRFVGCDVYNPVTGERVKKSDEWTKGVEVEDYPLAFSTLFPTKAQLPAVDILISKLKPILEAMEAGAGYKFYGSSLLIFHGQKEEQAGSDGFMSGNDYKPDLVVKMIDFAHSYSTEENNSYWEPDDKGADCKFNEKERSNKCADPDTLKKCQRTCLDKDYGYMLGVRNMIRWLEEFKTTPQDKIQSYLDKISK